MSSSFNHNSSSSSSAPRYERVEQQEEEDEEQLNSPPSSNAEAVNIPINTRQINNNNNDDDGQDDDGQDDEQPLATSSTSRGIYSRIIPTTTTTTTTRTTATRIHNNNDGVFSNISAKPGPVGKTYEDIEPPAYDEVTDSTSQHQQQVPPYFEAVISSGATFGEDGDVLVEGMEVGNPFTFVINMVVSMSFDFIGFLLTTMLATSHAARCGSRMGLSITMIRYGIFMKTRDVNKELNQYHYYDPDSTETPAHLSSQNEWMSYLLFIIGFFIMVHANAEYYRAHRLRQLLLSENGGGSAV